jgi:hypothetical protein
MKNLIIRPLVLFIAVLYSMAGFPQFNVVHIDNAVSPSDKDGIFYALPRTVIRIDVMIDKIENFKGPYADYAMKYLGLKNVVESNSVAYEVSGVHVSTAAEPDPDQYYFIELGEKGLKEAESGYLSFNRSGLILGVLPHVPDTLPEKISAQEAQQPQIREEDVFPEIFKYSADVSIVEKIDTIIRKVSIDTMTLQRQYLKRTMVEKSPEQKAKEAADFISKIKDNRFNLISGYQEVNYGKETLEYMDSQLKTLEKEYLKLFTGITIHKTISFSFYYTPNPTQVNVEVPVFKFSRSRGIQELDDPGGQIVTVRVQRSGTSAPVGTYMKKVEPGKKSRGFFYRIPELARVIVKADVNIQEETRCLVSQLGVVSFLPASSKKVQFFEETGGIKALGF